MCYLNTFALQIMAKKQLILCKYIEFTTVHFAGANVILTALQLKSEN